MIKDYLDRLNAPKLDNKVAFFRLLSVTQNAWLWIRDSLQSILAWETHPWMRKVIELLIKETSQWTSLADSMYKRSDVFSHDEISLIKSSETMGNLPEVLQNLADELENFQQIQSKVKSAMIYPSFVILIAIIAVIILLIYVIPTMVEMFPDEDDLPWITIFILDLSDFLQDYWWSLLLLFFWISIGYYSAYKYLLKFRIFMDKIFLTAPIIWWLSKKFNLYRFSKLLWDFYNAWVSPTESLEQIEWIFNNYYYKTKAYNMRQDLEVWLWFVESMEWSWLFDPILVQIIWIWEQTWNIWDVLLKMASFYREQLDTEIDGIMKLIEPALMWFIAIVVWVIVAAVFLPMAELVGTIA